MSGDRSAEGSDVAPAASFPPRRLRYEVCTQSKLGVKAALLAGADRVELCRDLAVGGLTPGAGDVEEAVGLAGDSLKVHVLVRSRPGGFVYDPDELDTMVEQVEAARVAGAHGIVVGALSPDGHVDESATAALVAAARPASVTFHRAFDEVRDPFGTYERLAALGVDRVLTAGGRPSAPEGAELLRRLVDRSAGGPIVLVGGGVTAANAAALVRQTGARELHFSARRRVVRPSGGTMSEAAPIDAAGGTTALAARVTAIIEAAEGAPAEGDDGAGALA